MPAHSRSHKAEAKYNVTTDFPHLGLHSAAATGNIGLVKYALSHGQPINSVVDGVLPLHAACSGGNDLVVKLLIENGADVNAPRLPRRYSTNPRTQSTGAPIVGTSGSTPLHFAAANGHTVVVLTLLRHGARPARADKHGVTPEMLARANGWVATADAIAQWVADKDRDLVERETLFSEEPVVDTEPRLSLKRSVDMLFKGGSSSPSPVPDSPFEVGDLPPRRPSLPHNALPSSTSSHRPRSAGTGASRRLTSKYSLLHIFRKQSTEDLEAEPARPGILRDHARSSSSSAGGGHRSLRFDEDGADGTRNASSPSTEGEVKAEGEDADADAEPEDDDDDDDEEEYGNPIPSLIAGHRRFSVQSLPSPLDFPFSINEPPVEMPPRIRGDSQSTTFSVPTPGPATSLLPPPRVVSPGDMDEGDEFGDLDAEARDTFKERQPEDRTRKGSLAKWRSRLSLDISAISTHAEAEALVQLTQRSVIEDDEGEIPLSARLAAYGESLQIERKFKRLESGRSEGDDPYGRWGHDSFLIERRASEGVDWERPYGVKARSASATLDREFAWSASGPRRKSGIDWNFSFDTGGPTPARRGRAQKPHTTSSSPAFEDANLGPRDTLPTGHMRSRSAAPPRIDSDLANALLATNLATSPSPCTVEVFAATPPRARTPEPKTLGGAPLKRVPSAPNALNDVAPAARRDHPRHVVRANKLARMGFTAEKPEKPQGPTSPAHRHTQLHGLKSFVQSLKGKA